MKKKPKCVDALTEFWLSLFYIRKIEVWNIGHCATHSNATQVQCLRISADGMKQRGKEKGKKEINERKMEGG
jgi:hypothetical protein